MTTTIQAANEELRAASTKTKHQHVSVTLAVGQMMCQGDVGILRLAELPKKATPIELPANRQVAPGTTKGSRHCAHGDLKFFRFPGDPLSDLAVRALADSWTLEHPEHGHVTVRCAHGDLFQFVHQQNEQRQRVMD